LNHPQLTSVLRFVAKRVAGLDGLRGLAALYVMLFHAWLLSFKHFPHNTGPGYLTWAMYGRLSVVFFLALSGFSLALGPAGNQWRLGNRRRLGNVARFLRRRAWRILPAYWAALAFSLVIAYHVPASHKGEPTHRSIAVFGLLLQDVFWAKTPNGAFWSVAVEAELYLLFPLLLFIRRRLGVVLLLAAVTVPVIVYGAVQGVPAEGDTGLTPHLAPVFAAGIAAAGIRAKLPWHWLAPAAILPVLFVIHFKGSYWTAHHYFWIDLAITPGLTMLILAVANGRLSWTRRLDGLGKISYSLYLIHLPILTVLAKKVAPHYAEKGPHTWIFVVVVGFPISLVAAWLFAQVFELPFQRHRSWRALAAAVRSGPRRSPAPPAATGHDPAGNRPRYPGADAPSPAEEAAGTPLPPAHRRTSDGFDLSRP
jgi:peptidoglycan/LPS O-acetylase OafA/YrhL